MFTSTATILKAVEALEKCAHIFEKEDQAQAEKRAEMVKKEFIEPIRDVHGFTPELATKLAGLDQEVLGWIKGLATQNTQTSGDYSSLGGPSLEEKHASEDYDSILAFVSRED